MLLDQFAYKLCTHLLNAALKHFALALLRRSEGTEYTGRRSFQSTVCRIQVNCNVIPYGNLFLVSIYIPPMLIYLGVFNSFTAVNRHGMPTSITS